MSKLTAVGLLLFALFFAVPAFAIDGQVLISQATVMAAGGFPYKITQPGSYKLSGNLVVPANTDGIDIMSDDVTLDLNGFDINGPVTCTGSGRTISCSGSTSGYGVKSSNSNIAVKNGSVTGMFAGLELTGTLGRVEEMSAYQNRSSGISVTAGIVRRCASNMNGGNGISLGSGVVEENVSDNNGAYGFLVLYGPATVIGNEASNNSVYGLRSDNSVFGSNAFFGNGFGDVDTVDGGGSKSQDNNICTDTAC